MEVFLIQNYLLNNPENVANLGLGLCLCFANSVDKIQCELLHLSANAIDLIKFDGICVKYDISFAYNMGKYLFLSYLSER